MEATFRHKGNMFEVSLNEDSKLRTTIHVYEIKDHGSFDISHKESNKYRYNGKFTGHSLKELAIRAINS